MFARLTLAAALVGASLVALTAGAGAADLPSRAPAPAPAPKAYLSPRSTLSAPYSSWTGGYAGLTGSYDIWRNPGLCLPP
ncbi:MAG: hypothetical protein JWL62_1767 [Hyphomicrobiales bacterium]|nr:hypothetical protein [Hyphomicrobiales bacterium]